MNVKASIGYVLLLVAVASLLLGVGSLSRDAHGTGIALVAHSQVIGVIFIFRSYPDLFSANDKALLGSFAGQAAIAVHNARLYGQVNLEKQRLDALLDSAADGIMILNADLTI